MMEQIKRADPHPYFQAYSVVQEGISKPKDLGGESKPMYWVREAIAKAKSALKIGLQFFMGHNADNSTTGRTSIGKVAGIISKVINGKLSQIVIGYFPNKDKVKNLDVCSIEADVIVSETDTIDIAKRIKNLSGIALASSRLEKPAFSGAVKLASLQCFEGETKIIDNNGVKTMTKDEFMSAISANFNWLKEAVEIKRIFPSQLGFTESDLRGDFAFKELFQGVDDNKTKLETLQKELEGEKEGRKKDSLETLKVTAIQRLEKLIPDGFTEQQKKFVVKTFDPEKLEDLTEKGLTDYLTKSKENYKKYAEVFGIPDITGNENKQDGKDRFDVNNPQEVEDSIVDDILEIEKE